MATLVRIAAIPNKNDPSIITIVESFLVLHVLYLFSCRKGDSAMSVMVEAIPESVRLRVTGDIETTLTVPYDDDDRFLLGFSDGTLLQGAYNDRLECIWAVARDGAGIVRFADGTAVLEWSAEWVTVSVYDANVVEPPVPEVLPLFPDLDRWAA